MKSPEDIVDQDHQLIINQRQRFTEPKD